MFCFWVVLSAGAVEYTDRVSSEESDPLPAIVPDITLNNLIVRLQ